MTVTTPRHQPGPVRPEDDPTGVRALLSSLPEPGPMPEHLVERISASLAAEQANRSRVVRQLIAAGADPCTRPPGWPPRPPRRCRRGGRRSAGAAPARPAGAALLRRRAA